MACLIFNFAQLNKKQLIPFCKNELKNSNEQWQKEIYAFILEWFDKNTSIKAKTSGSTGVPKTIWIEKTSMIASAKMTGEFFKFSKNTKALLCLSPQFIAGKMMLVRAIIWQMNLICVKPNGHPLNDYHDEIDFAAMLPLQVFNSTQNKTQLEKIKTILIGGGVIDKRLEDKIHNLKPEFFSSFGMTETLSHIALRPLNKNIKPKTYKALNGISLSCDDRGCLKIKAPKLLKDEMVTNDQVNLISSSEFEWLGRFDHVINSGGIKLFPEQIEEQLASIINQPFFLIGIPDESLGEKMILFIETDMYSLEQKEILLTKIEFCLENFQRPRDIHIIPKFKRTATGKIQRKATLSHFNEDLKEKNTPL